MRSVFIITFILLLEYISVFANGKNVGEYLKLNVYRNHKSDGIYFANKSPEPLSFVYITAQYFGYVPSPCDAVAERIQESLIIELTYEYENLMLQIGGHYYIKKKFNGLEIDCSPQLAAYTEMVMNKVTYTLRTMYGGKCDLTVEDPFIEIFEPNTTTNFIFSNKNIKLSN
jgi:hypothetical protein